MDAGTNVQKLSSTTSKYARGCLQIGHICIAFSPSQTNPQLRQRHFTGWDLLTTRPDWRLASSRLYLYSCSFSWSAVSKEDRRDLLVGLLLGRGG